MPETMRPTIPVFVYLVSPDSSVYLQRRLNPGYLDGYYEPPAGKVDYAEFPRLAACREVREEAGVEINPTDLELFHSYINTSGDDPWLGLMYRTRKWSGSPRIMEPDKCDSSGFFNIDSLPKVTPQVADGIGRLMTAQSIEMSEYDSIAIV